MKPLLLLTLITGWRPERHNVRWTQEAVNPTIWSHGCDWFHYQRETSDPTVSPDDDSCMVSTLWGKDGKTKPLPPASQHPSQKYMAVGGAGRGAWLGSGNPYLLFCFLH